MKWINKASEDKSTRICWVYNDKGCGFKKATCNSLLKIFVVSKGKCAQQYAGHIFIIAKNTVKTRD